MPYDDVESFRAAETFLRKVLEKPFPQLADAPHIAAARGLESLARLKRKIASLEEDTIARLQDGRAHARSAAGGACSATRSRRSIAAQGVDADTLEAVLGRDDPRSGALPSLALSGSGSAIDDEERVGYIRKALSDTSYMVRLEAVRAWTRRGVKEHGCQPLLDALNDPSMHVVLAALDALGDVCRDDAAITARMASEARTPRPNGRWQREMHAFVALAKRDRERAAISMLAFAMHQTWQVRMYTARAAAIVDDVAVLTRLASDPEDNVAEAALMPLRRLIGADSDAAVRRRPQSPDAHRSAKHRAAVRGHPHRGPGARRRHVDAGAGRRARRRARTDQRRAVRDVARYAARAHHSPRPSSARPRRRRR